MLPGQFVWFQLRDKALSSQDTSVYFVGTPISSTESTFTVPKRSIVPSASTYQLFWGVSTSSNTHPTEWTSDITLPLSVSIYDLAGGMGSTVAVQGGALF
jgi:hypothetical protein